jgi:integrase
VIQKGDTLGVKMATPFKHPRTGVYYLRRAVPKDIQEALGKTEYLKSLGTKDPLVAKKRFVDELQECEAVFDRARRGTDVLDDAQIKAVGEAWAAHCLGEDEEVRLDGLSEREYARKQETLDVVIPGLKAELARGMVDEGTTYEFNDFLQSHGYNVPANTENYRRVHMGMLRAWVRALEQQQLRHQGEPIETPQAPEIGPKRLQGDGFSDPSKLSGAFDGWKAERKPSAKAWSEWSLALRRFIEVNGDPQLRKIDRGHIRKFKDALSGKGLSTASIKKQLGAVRTVLGWAVENGSIDQNVAAGVTVRDAKVRKQTRLPYADSDLKVIFSSPIYTAGERPAAGGGEAAYWLPLMALYMGPRLEEIGQALVADVITVGKVLCLSINDEGEGKSVKTVSSRRLVPVHPELVRLGFNDYVATLAKSGRLFPDLQQDQFDKWTGNFSKWWGRWARGLGIADRRKVFHSFRHTFKAACRRAGIQEEVHDLLTGHQGAGVGRSYGRAEDYSDGLVATLAEALRKVEYKDAGLSIVKAWNGRSEPA